MPSTPTKLATLAGLALAGLATVIVASANAPRVVTVLAAAAAPKSAPATATRPVEPGAPVVVELFTSEGCSSCPPADRLLAQLDQTHPVPGAQIIALEQHVDYWNSQGWMDPFSSALFTERQQDYVRALRVSTAYTPEMVVDGAAEFVGGDAQAVVAAIQKSARTPKAAVVIEPVADKKPPDPQSVPLRVQVSSVPDWNAHSAADVVFAITEDSLSSNVTRGENAGSQLSHRAVVREMRTLGKVAASGSFETQWEVKLAKNWKRDNLRAVAFVQARGNRRILGAAETSLAAVPAPAVAAAAN